MHQVKVSKCLSSNVAHFWIQYSNRTLQEKKLILEKLSRRIVEASNIDAKSEEFRLEKLSDIIVNLTNLINCATCNNNKKKP